MAVYFFYVDGFNYLGYNRSKELRISENKKGDNKMAVFKPKSARLTSKGQITIPKSVRQALNLQEGDQVIFAEDDGKMIVKKGALVAFDEFANVIGQEAKDKGITEEEVLEDLKQVRREMWSERKGN
ncbi:AbrB/MazE/SpoVT family DNA-binding domain-containing protein [Lentibacillus sp. CBA3610]|uniref:AbrB/MazE/SpoVT family DNA-binding domain-containing protein n=1 Tax=Lentibacillus sp. CBA3610 TaxID=2518176 RepID=UPI0020D1F8F4|nr:AbrB/MazE/SpoVT family DNA-binding domain-containing protein [Lentibacillus sp. CBA3610]